MDECEIELKMEVLMVLADTWWDNLEPEDRIDIYLRSKEVAKGDKNE